MNMLSESQHLFFELLARAPWLTPYWNMEERACHIDRLEGAMGSWSHGEQILARFFVMVWFGQNRMDFDLLDAASVLDHPQRILIVHWLSEPFWP